jgi:hypothetical protein
MVAARIAAYDGRPNSTRGREMAKKATTKKTAKRAPAAKRGPTAKAPKVARAKASKPEAVAQDPIAAALQRRRMAMLSR